MARLQTVVELPEFQPRVKSTTTNDERQGAISFVAANPERGTSLSGGLRKIRIPRTGGGKRGGFRVFYEFGGIHIPICLGTEFAKYERASLTKTEHLAAVEPSRKIIAEY